MSKVPITKLALKSSIASWIAITLLSLFIHFNYDSGNSFNEELINLLNNQDTQNNPLLGHLIENFNVEEPLMIGSLDRNRRISTIMQEFLINNNLDYFDIEINFIDNTIVKLRAGDTFEAEDNFITTYQPPFPSQAAGGMSLENIETVNPYIQATLNEGHPNQTFIRLSRNYAGGTEIIYAGENCSFNQRIRTELPIWDTFEWLRDGEEQENCDMLTDLALNQFNNN